MHQFGVLSFLNWNKRLYIYYFLWKSLFLSFDVWNRAKKAWKSQYCCSPLKLTSLSYLSLFYWRIPTTRCLQPIPSLSSFINILCNHGFLSEQYFLCATAAIKLITLVNSLHRKNCLHPEVPWPRLVLGHGDKDLRVHFCVRGSRPSHHHLLRPDDPALAGRAPALRF